ncbi:hypothetical protein CCP2SC5_30033 [Azospirillaceae bacterium]
MQSSTGTVIYSSAGRLRSLPTEVVCDLARAIPAVLVPFSSPMFEGVVEIDGCLTAQFDLVQAMGGAARTGAYAILIKTSVGLIRLRVDSVSLTSSASFDDAPPGLPEIEALIAGLAPADTIPQLCADSDGDVALKRFDALVVKSGEVVIALPALDVERIERIDRRCRVEIPRKGESDERIVVVAEEIMSGWSLGAHFREKMNKRSDGMIINGVKIDDEPWGVTLRIGERRAVLTVAEIKGITSTPLHHIQCTRHRSGVSTWLPDSDYGVIELIAPTEFDGVYSSPLALEEVFSAPSLEKQEQREVDRETLTARMGPFSCVFSSDMVIEVLGESQLQEIGNHRKNYPFFDLGEFLGFSLGSKTTRARGLVLRRLKRRSIVLLTSGVERTPLLPEWRPLPIVPPLVRLLFQSVRIEGSSCSFMIKETLFKQRPAPEIIPFLRAAYLGRFGGF